MHYSQLFTTALVLAAGVSAGNHHGGNNDGEEKPYKNKYQQGNYQGDDQEQGGWGKGDYQQNNYGNNNDNYQQDNYQQNNYEQNNNYGQNNNNYGQNNYKPTTVVLPVETVAPYVPVETVAPYIPAEVPTQVDLPYVPTYPVATEAPVEPYVPAAPYVPDVVSYPPYVPDAVSYPPYIGASVVAPEVLPSAAPSYAAGGGGEIVHVVQVGQNGLKFEPSNVIANVGDFVQFQFWPKNHSVVQSTFDQPCIPIQNVLPNVTNSFFSGFMPTERTTSGEGSNTLTYTIKVTTDKPLWYYCSQGKHCQGGMVGAINAKTTGEKTIEAFIGLAAGAVENLTPGQAPGAAAPDANLTAPGVPTAGFTTFATGTATLVPGIGATATAASPDVPLQATGAASSLMAPAQGGFAGLLGAALAFFLL